MNHEEQSVLNAFMTFLDSYARKNVEECMSAIALSKPILLLGTNDNEVFKTAQDVRDAFEKDFANMTNIRWGKQRYMHVIAGPTIAGVVVELPISYQTNGKDVEVLFRYALTLTKEDERWKICSGMASVPYATGTYSLFE